MWRRMTSLPMDGAPNSHVVLRPGDFLICYPEDGHHSRGRKGT